MMLSRSRFFFVGPALAAIVVAGACSSPSTAPDNGSGGQAFGGSSSGGSSSGGSSSGGSSSGGSSANGGSSSGGSSANGGSAGSLSLDASGGTGATASGGSGGAGASGGASGAGGSSSVDGGPGGTCSVDGGSGITGPGTGTGGNDTCNNGLDDNGNGFVDEGCPCAIGTSQACFLGPASLAGVGACIKGTQACAGAGEFKSWGPCLGSGVRGAEVCEGSVDENCDGTVDENCGCCTGDTRPCGVVGGACTAGTQTCVAGQWGACGGGAQPVPEICGNGIDDNCDGVIDEGCIIDQTVNLDGDCLTAACPPQAPHPVGCTLNMAGNDPRGCVANSGGALVYFQEGDNCGAGRVTGTLRCSSQPGPKLDASNCTINKSQPTYAASPSGCAPTS